jgi:hypothetical protein
MPKITVTDNKGLVQETGAGFSLSSSLILDRQTVAAAGSNQGTATAISGNQPLVVATGADGSKGVRLPAVAGLTAGTTFLIQNFGAAVLEVFPATGDRVYPAADNAGISVAAYGFLQVSVADATGWFGNEGVIAA